MTTPPLSVKADANAVLGKKIVDLEVMIHYCAQSQKYELGQDLIQKYAGVAQRFEQGKAEEALELRGDVICLYDQLSRLIAPVTPMSIRIGNDFENSEIRDDVSKLIRFQVWILSISFLFLVLNTFFSNEQLQKVNEIKFIVLYSDIMHSIFYFMIGVMASSIYSIRLLYSRVRERNLYVTDANYYLIRNIIGGVMAFAFVSYFRPFIGETTAVGRGIPTTATSQNGLDASGIAFLTGYGVEIIYTALDSMVLRLRDLLDGLPKLPGVLTSVKVSLPQGQAPAASTDGATKPPQN